MMRRLTSQWVQVLTVSMLIAAAALSLGNVALFAVYMVVVIIAWLYWNNYPLPLSLGVTALLSLATPPIDIVLTSISILLIDNALKMGNERPWWFYAASLAASTSLAVILRQFYIAVSFTIPLLYILLISFINAIRFHTVIIELRPSRNLRINAGSELSYSLAVTTKPPRSGRWWRLRPPRGTSG